VFVDPGTRVANTDDGVACTVRFGVDLHRRALAILQGI